MFNHASWVKALLTWFGYHEREWNIRALTGMRLQVAEGVCHSPDLIIDHREVPKQDIFLHPPAAVIEVLRPQDRMEDVLELLIDYERVLVRNIVLVSSRNGQVWLYRDGQLVRRDVPTLEGLGCPIDWQKIRLWAE